jgi:hypothetical protein
LVADDFGVGGGVVAGFEGVVRVVEEFELRGAVGGAGGDDAPTFGADRALAVGPEAARGFGGGGGGEVAVGADVHFVHHGHDGGGAAPRAPEVVVGIEYRELRPRWLVGRDVEVAGQHFISCADTDHGETALERDGCKAGNEDGGDHGEVQEYAFTAMVITIGKLKLRGKSQGWFERQSLKKIGRSLACEDWGDKKEAADHAEDRA